MRQAFDAGCSAMSWQTADGDALFARSLDFTDLPEGSRVTYAPAGSAYTAGGETLHARYAAVGMGMLLPGPVLFEGMNTAGLMGAQLYYRVFAHYPDAPRPGTRPIEPPMVVYHLLAQCGSVAQAADLLEHAYTPVNRPMLGAVPPLHWMFTDRTGESMVVESDADGLHIYRNTLGVMTNSPGYPWHRQNLLCYGGLRDREYGAPAGCDLTPCFSGSGMQGLPGDWSAPSRFVRLCFARAYGLKGTTEDSAVARLFRLMDTAAFPLGLARVDEDAFDYTIYTVVLSAASGRMYWTTYENQRVRAVDLGELCAHDCPIQFDLELAPQFDLRKPQDGLQD